MQLYFLIVYIVIYLQIPCSECASISTKVFPPHPSSMGTTNTSYNLNQ